MTIERPKEVREFHCILKKDTGAVSAISEQIWKRDIERTYRINIPWLVIVICGILLAIYLWAITAQEGITMVSAFGWDALWAVRWLIQFDCLISVLVILMLVLLVVHRDQQHINWLSQSRWLLNRMNYSLELSAENIAVYSYDQKLSWPWEAVKWYRVYPKMVLAAVEDYFIYIDITRFDEAQAVALQEILQENSTLNQEERLTRNHHWMAMAKLHKTGRRLKRQKG